MASCPSCGRDVAAGFAFCPHCGAPIDAAAPAGEERKLVTLLFADITGSTGLAESLDAEVVRDLMGAYFAIAREEIEARGGTVEKFIGDAVMAVFGVPVAHEDDPARALRAALAVRDALGRLNESRQAAGGLQLQVRIGVNTGDVVATTTPRPGEGMVTGDAVNVASRIQSMAEPGEILAGERTIAAAPGFIFRNVGPRVIRGKEATVAVGELVAERAESAERGVPGLRSPLIGREAEMGVLLSLYDRVASESRPHLVTLYGDPGVGKSRLTTEFLANLARRAPRPDVVRGRCLPYGSGVTFWPLAEILKARAGILDSDGPADVAAKLKAFGDGLITPAVAEDPDRTTALLGYTVGITVPGHEFDHLEPDQLRAEVHGAWRSLFSALANRGPQVVVIEDIHWADGALLDLLDELANRVQGSVLILCPARPELTERRPDWGGGRRSFSSVVLDPLPAGATEELIDRLLDVADVPDDLRDRIVKRAEGNPFFVEEILRQLIDEGRLVREADGWRAAPTIKDVEIPDSVQAVLAARIDLLGPQEKRTLQAAAVVGRVFWAAPVARFLDGAAGQLDGDLRALENRDLVLLRLTSSVAGQAEYIFKHALVRDVAYESIPRRERAHAHLRVAQWIEDALGSRRVEVVELLAHHYTEAEHALAWATVGDGEREEVRARTVAVLYEAAREAASHIATDRARERVSLGLELAKGPIERAEGLEILHGLVLWSDHGDDAYQLAREAVDLRVSAGPRTPEERLAVARTVGALLAIPTRWPGLMRQLPTREEAAPYLDLGFEMLPDGDSEERLRLLLARGSWCWGFDRADLDPDHVAEDIGAAEEAIAMARRMDRVDLLSAALDIRGGSDTLIGGGYGSMGPNLAERLSLVPRLDDRREILDIYGVNAWAAAHIGEFRRAAEFARLAVDVASATQVSIPLPSAFLGLCQYRLGKWTAFWETYAMADALADPTRPLRYQGFRLYGIAAYLHEVAGEPEAADAIIERLASAQTTLGEAGVSGARLWLVQVDLRRGAFETARRRLALEDPVRGPQNRDLDFEAWAELIAAEGTWDEAEAVLRGARAHAHDSVLRYLPVVADRLEGQVAVAGGDLERGIELLEQARTDFAELETSWERARTELALAQVFRAAGRLDEAASVASEALIAFRGFGAAREINAAEEIAAPPPGTLP